MHPMLVVLGGPTPVASKLNLAAIVAFALVDGVAVRLRGGSPASGASDRNSYRLIIAVQLVALAAALASARYIDTLALPGSPYAWVAAGLMLMLAGAALRTWAIVTLGRLFRRVVVVDAGHEVVSSGPYRWLRHPSYTGLIIGFAGFGLVLDNTLAFAIMAVVPTLAYLYRIAVEEAELSRKLGERYTQFARGRKRLIPGVW